MLNYKYFFTFIILFSYSNAELIKPANGEELSYIHILFEWDQEPDAINYNIQVSNQSSFNSILIDIEESSNVYINKNVFDWDNTYYWRLRTIYSDGSYGQWSPISYFSIGNKILTNLDVDIYNEELIQDGLVMYSQFSPYFAVGVIDKWGNEIWNTQTAYMNHINEYGQLYGVNGQGVKFNFHHDLLWETPPGTDIDSHEVKQIPNGNYMAFVPTFQLGPIAQGPWTTLFQNLGYTADGIANEIPWMGLRIVEWDQYTGEEVWNWEPFEHFTMSDYDIYEQGGWWGALFDGFFDWMHSNAFHFDAEESVIYVSHRHLSRISKISYPDGNVIWNMGLPEEYNTGNNNICTDLLFSFQHHIQLLDDGDLLFFDNGNLSDLLFDEQYRTTRIRRIKVLNDNSCEIVWQYELPPYLFGEGMGSVQLLENGNYMIYTYGNGFGSDCSIFELDQNDEIIWKVTSQNPNAAWYRAYKIPSIHPDAFSVIANGYTTLDNDTPVIEFDNNLLKFTIYNKSGYTLRYKFIFTDLSNDDEIMFENEEGEFLLSPYESTELLFSSNNNMTTTNISLDIWPIHHSYGKKELQFSIFSNSLFGDINADNIINILDIVFLVNIILGNDDFAQSADLNQDGISNILDIVMLVSIILS